MTKGEAYISQVIQGIQSGFIELSSIATPPATLGKIKVSSGCFAYIEKVYTSAGTDDKRQHRKNCHIGDYLDRTIDKALARLKKLP